MKVIYEIENLDCPHCAAEIERAIGKLEGIRNVSLSLPTKQLHLDAAETDGLLDRIQKTADAIEDGVIFRERTAQKHHHAHLHDHHKKEFLLLGMGVLLFLVGIAAELFLQQEIISKVFLLIAYLVMGWEVLLNSIKSIGKGQIFDENFLMSVATIGALAIGCWEEAAGVMLFFRIGELFEHLAVNRSRKAVMDAIDLRPETALRKNGTQFETIPAQEIRIGDTLLVRAGDRIPVDGVVTKGESALDTSAMTGEPVPLQVSEGDTVMSGCINLSGVLELRASATLQNSMVSRILESVESAAAGKPKIDRFITRFARIYTPIVVAVALLTAIVPSLVTGNWSHWIYTALNFLMISCPCALVLSVPLAFFSGIGAGSTMGILFKDGISLEVLSNIKAVVMDKTGTLTNGRFSVRTVETNHCDMTELIAACVSCEASSAHPIAKSILEFAAENEIPVVPANDIYEIAGKGITGNWNGRKIVCGNAKLLTEMGISVPEVSATGTHVHTAADGTYLGCIVLADLPKPNAASAVKGMRERGLHTVMLTGDHEVNANEISGLLGIAETHAGLLPTEKPEYMEKIRKEHGGVLFVGDGINDAPVLSGADVGAAMGSGADAAMEAADVVFLSSDPEAILTSIEIAERVNSTAKITVAFALGVKLLIMLLGFAGFANMWLSIFADTGVTVLCVLYVIARVHLFYQRNKKKGEKRK